MDMVKNAREAMTLIDRYKSYSKFVKHLSYINIMNRLLIACLDKEITNLKKKMEENNNLEAKKKKK